VAPTFSKTTGILAVEYNIINKLHYASFPLEANHTVLHLLSNFYKSHMKVKTDVPKVDRKGTLSSKWKNRLGKRQKLINYTL